MSQQDYTLTANDLVNINTKKIIRYSNRKKPTMEQLSTMITSISSGVYTSEYPINNTTKVVGLTSTEIMTTDNTNLVIAKINDDGKVGHVKFYIRVIGKKGTTLSECHPIELEKNKILQSHNVNEKMEMIYDGYIELIDYIIYISQLILQKNKKD